MLGELEVIVNLIKGKVDIRKMTMIWKPSSKIIFNLFL